MNTDEPADDEERDSSGHLRHDLSEVARDLGVLTSRVGDLEDTVDGHGWVLDGIEDFVDGLAERQSGDDPPARESEPSHNKPERHEPRPGEAGQADRTPGPEPDTEQGDDRPAIDIDLLCDWVHNNIAQLVERKVRGRVDAGPHWCPQWWQHPEAILRFEGLRRAWETLVPDGGLGLITYLGHLDAILTALMADAGPFHAGSCKHDRHNDVATLGDHSRYTSTVGGTSSGSRQERNEHLGHRPSPNSVGFADAALYDASS